MTTNFFPKPKGHFGISRPKVFQDILVICNKKDARANARVYSEIIAFI